MKKMQSTFQERKQARDNKIAMEYKGLIQKGSPKLAAKRRLAEKYSLDVVTIYRILG